MCAALTLCLCVVVVGNVNATDYNVNARIDAAMSPTPAAITYPVTNTTAQNPNQTISGTCPVITPALIVVLWRDTTFLGSAACATDGTFTATITLTAGLNNITPKIVNITGNSGTDGTPIQITYDAPVPQTTNTVAEDSQPADSSTTETPQTTTPQLAIESPHEFITVGSDGQTSLVINIKDGEAPYKVDVDWGDGTTDTYTFDTAGEKTIKHRFNSGNGFTITIKTTDKNGVTVSLVLAAVSSVTIQPPSTAQKINNQLADVPKVIIVGGGAVAAGTAGVLALNALGLNPGVINIPTSPNNGNVNVRKKIK